MSDAAVAVLWTGGWDSTFIVLDGVLRRRAAVEPHYVHDPSRRSAAREIATMDVIRAEVTSRDPEAAARLAPTRVVPLGEVPDDPDTDRRHAAWAGRTHVAPQYRWLSAYAARQPRPLALGIIRRDGGLRDVIGAELHVVDGVRRLRPTPSDDAFELFRPFTFPTIELTKIDMRDEAEAAGWLDLLERTWFCHAPLRDGRPCGLCHPCHDALHQGMARRLPWPSRLRGALLDAAPGPRARDLLRRALKRLTR